MSLAFLAPAKANDPFTLVNPVVGTWTVTTTFNMPGGAPPFVFTELATFAAGGTFLGTFSLDHNGANPAPLGPFLVDFSVKMGNWGLKPGTFNQYNLIFKEFLFAGPNTPDAIYGPHFNGQHVGAASVVASPVLNTAGDTLTGPFTVKFTNTQDQLLFTGTGSFVAKRLK